MRSEDKTYQLIEDYLNNNLAEADRKAFEKELQENSDLQQKLKLHRLANELVVENRLLQVKEILQSQRYSGGKSTWKYIAGGIAGALLITGIIVFKNHDKTEMQSSEKIVVSTNPDVEVNKEEKKQPSQNKVDNLSSEKGSQNPTSENLMPNIEKEIPASDSDSIGNYTTQKEKPAEKNPEEKNTMNTNIVDPCDNINITERIFKNPACAGEEDGSIIVTEIKGGKSPYNISIYDGNNELQHTHSALLTGTYHIEIKDGAGCSKKIANVIVSKKVCNKDYSFNPSIGEFWNIPLGAKQGKLFVYDKSGNVYFEKEINAGVEEQWSGESKSGEINTGYYIFVIKYNDGSQVQGSVTIVR